LGENSPNLVTLNGSNLSRRENKKFKIVYTNYLIPRISSVAVVVLANGEAPSEAAFERGQWLRTEGAP
jgi:hypothetical protein